MSQTMERKFQVEYENHENNMQISGQMVKGCVGLPPTGSTICRPR